MRVEMDVQRCTGATFLHTEKCVESRTWKAGLHASIGLNDFQNMKVPLSTSKNCASNADTSEFGVAQNRLDYKNSKKY